MFFENLLLATGNRGKYEEFRAILPESFVGSLLFAPEVGGLAVEETGGSYAMNAVLKAKAWAEASGLLSLADDRVFMILSGGSAVLFCDQFHE